MITTDGTVGLAEGVIDDICFVSDYLSKIFRLKYYSDGSPVTFSNFEDRFNDPADNTCMDLSLLKDYETETYELAQAGFFECQEDDEKRFAVYTFVCEGKFSEIIIDKSREFKMTHNKWSLYSRMVSVVAVFCFLCLDFYAVVHLCFC